MGLFGNHEDTEVKRPNIVCLCGSTRFIETFQKTEFEETLKGNIVLTIGCDTKSDGELFKGPKGELIKAKLDQLHFEKIKIADEVLVLNVNGYIGESTRNEIAFAESIKKSVRYLVPLPSPQEIPSAIPRCGWAEDIQNLHDKFFPGIQDKIAGMSESIRMRLLEFRRMFLAEELQEIRDAKSPECVVDGLIDLIVVAVGTLYLFGVRADDAWDEVFRANIGKKIGVNDNRVNPFGFPDLVKPPGWVPPNHTGNTGSLTGLNFKG